MPGQDATTTDTAAADAATGDATTDEAAQAAAAAKDAATGDVQPDDAAKAAAAQAEADAAAAETPEAKAAAAAKEAELKTAAAQYAKEQIALANRTMAAARRAERAVDAVKTDNAKLKEDVRVYTDFVDQLRSQPLTALGRLGFKTFKEFADHCVAAGGDAKPKTDTDRLSDLERKLADREEGGKKAEADRAATAFQSVLFKAVDEQKATFTRTATKLGKATLWEAIGHYGKTHGIPVHEMPDQVVAALAQEVEKDLRADFGDPTISGSQADAKTGDSAAAAAASAARNSGKTLAGKPTSGAPGAKKYSLDPDERQRQVNEEMRAEGLL